jgi:hypothetical protein
MARSFGIVEEKLREADFFLNQLCRSNNLSFEARCFFSAFVSAARSVTLTMQASLKGVRDFDQWYDEIRGQLKTDRLAPHFVEIRNDIVHIGINPLNQVTLEHLQEHLSRQLRQRDRAHILVLPDPNREGASVLVAATQACTEYFTSLVSVTFECYQRFLTVVDPKWYFTTENFQAMGRTFEDAVVELGFPPEWASCVPMESGAWKALRLQQPPCQINDIFRKYLDRTIPDPDDLEP